MEAEGDSAHHPGVPGLHGPHRPPLVPVPAVPVRPPSTLLTTVYSLQVQHIHRSLQARRPSGSVLCQLHTGVTLPPKQAGFRLPSGPGPASEVPSTSTLRQN